MSITESSIVQSLSCLTASLPFEKRKLIKMIVAAGATFLSNVRKGRWGARVRVAKLGLDLGRVEI